MPPGDLCFPGKGPPGVTKLQRLSCLHRGSVGPRRPLGPGRGIGAGRIGSSKPTVKKTRKGLFCQNAKETVASSCGVGAPEDAPFTAVRAQSLWVASSGLRGEG